LPEFTAAEKRKLTAVAGRLRQATFANLLDSAHGPCNRTRISMWSVARTDLEMAYRTGQSRKYTHRAPLAAVFS